MFLVQFPQLSIAKNLNPSLKPLSNCFLVGIAQLVEPWIVAPEVVGSSPSSHPFDIFYFMSFNLISTLDSLQIMQLTNYNPLFTLNNMFNTFLYTPTLFTSIFTICSQNVTTMLSTYYQPTSL